MTQHTITPESVQAFYDRTYTNHTLDKVFVFPSVRGEGISQKWNIRQAREYIRYLEDNEVII